jgi:hypothetical protein
MNDKNSLHFDFLLDAERVSSSSLRLRFLIPVIGVLCLLIPLVVGQLDSSTLNGITSKKLLLDAEVAKLKNSHELVLKDRAEEKELTAQLQQIGFYQSSKNPVGATLAHLTNCVTSQLQLTELRLTTQMPPPLAAPQLRPKNVPELAKLCPTNTLDAFVLQMKGRYYQSGVEPLELNRFLLALQGNAFTSLVSQANRKVDYREESGRASGESTIRDVYAFDVTYECLPRRFQ